MNLGQNIVLSMLLALLSFDANAKAENFIEKFGVKEGKTVNNGFMFIDGKYLESPYVISRRGLQLFVNNITIPRPSRHPGLKPLTGDLDPNQLSEEQQQKLVRLLNSTQQVYEKYLERGYGYLFFSKGGNIRLNPYTMAYDFPNVVELLTSNKSKSEKLFELRPHNWHLFADIEPLLDNFFPSLQLSSKLNQQAQELLRINEFCSSVGLPVNNGFMFFDGRYVEAPYKVERKGLGVFINGIMVFRPPEWPIKEFLGDIDPKMPAEINEETSWEDDIVQEYLSKKHAYLRKQHVTDEVEIKRMERVIRELPFVTEAKKIDPDRPYILQVKTTEGLIVNRSLISMYGRRGIKYDKGSVLKLAEEQRIYYQDALAKGDCYLLSSKGGRTHLSENSIVEALIPAIKILRSDKSAAEKLLELQNPRLNISEEISRELVNNFSASPQLEARLNELAKQKKNGATPIRDKLVWPD
jgi:hypothetical protein